MRDMRVLLLTGVILSIGCGDSDADGDPAPADTARTTESAESIAGLLSPIRAVSVAEVEFAQLAAQRAGSPGVRDYAQTVAADHRALIGVLDSVARVRSATLAETGEMQEMVNTVRMSHSGLENVAGPDFDLPFVRAEVESHRLLLDGLDQRIIPGASSADLRTLLTDIRAMADAHLTRARQLLAQQVGRAAEPTPSAPQRQPQPQAPPPQVPPRP
jgi:putative membrane protein